MKRQRLTALLLLGSLLFQGCEEKQLKPDYLRQLEFSIEDATRTKATLDPASGKYAWEEGDEILVMNGKSHAVFTLESGNVFSTDTPDFLATEDYTAIYPASAVISPEPAPANISLNIADSQVYDGESVKGQILYAQSSQKSIEMRSLMAVVEFNLPQDVSLTSAKLSVPSGKLAGEATISSGKLSISGPGSNELNLRVTAPSALGTVCVTLPEGVYSEGLKAELTYSDGRTEELSCEGPLVLRAGNIRIKDLLAAKTIFPAGDGSENSPYEIRSAEDLIMLGTLVNNAETNGEFAGAHYRLTDSPDLSSSGDFEPIGKSAALPFKGSFDGNGLSIKGLRIRNTEAAASGLFGYLEDATVCNFNLEEADVDSEHIFSGCVAGSCLRSTIENVKVSGKFRAYGKSIVVKACGYAPVDSNNAGYNGGIAGLADHSVIRGCSFEGTETIYGKFSGGIVGVCYESAVENCSIPPATVLNIYYHYTGGIIGRAIGAANVIKGCAFEGSLASTGYVNGGIVGQLLGGKVSDCVFGSNGFVGGDKFFVAGIAGAAQPLESIEISRCASYGRIRGAYSVAGICGYVGPGSGASTDKDLILGSSTANKSVSIYDCGSIGNHITATGGNSNKYPIAGGIIGWSHGNLPYSLKGCFSLPGLIETTYGDNVNAVLCGISSYQNNKGDSVIENCYSAYGLTDFRVCGDTPANEELWYAAVAIRCTQPTTVSNCYSESPMRTIYTSDNATTSGLEELSATQMTDGTLLAKLQATANGTVWVAGENGYPSIEGLPADPHAKKAAKKRVSVIGDSISTFKGFIPGNYSAHYPATDGSLTLPSETYWWRLIYDHLQDAELDVNIAFSGSTVTNTTEENFLKRYTSEAWWHNSFSERFAACGGCGNPDIILIHGGTNDWAHNVDPLAPGVEIRNDAGNSFGGSAPSTEQMEAMFAVGDAASTRAQVNALPDGSFCEAYIKLLCQIRERYPDCKVVCIIGDYLSISIEKSIQLIAEHYGAKTVNLLRVNGFNDLGGYSPETLSGLGQPQPNMPKHDHTDLNSYGGCHPGSEAMDFIATKIYNELGSWLEM